MYYKINKIIKYCYFTVFSLFFTDNLLLFYLIRKTKNLTNRNRLARKYYPSLIRQRRQIRNFVKKPGSHISIPFIIIAGGHFINIKRNYLSP
jgi:hypothetical protein